MFEKLSIAVNVYSLWPWNENVEMGERNRSWQLKWPRYYFHKLGVLRLIPTTCNGSAPRRFFFFPGNWLTWGWGGCQMPAGLGKCSRRLDTLVSQKKKKTDEWESKYAKKWHWIECITDKLEEALVEYKMRMWQGKAMHKKKVVKRRGKTALDGFDRQWIAIKAYSCSWVNMGK